MTMNTYIIFGIGFVAGLITCILALRFFFKRKAAAVYNNKLSATDSSTADYPNTQSFSDLLQDKFLSLAYATSTELIAKEALSIDDLAAAMAISRSKLFRVIKAKTGSSPSNFIRKVRLYQAQELLMRDTSQNIGQIAYSVGFKDPAHFSRSFAEEYGCSPKQLRKVGKAAPTAAR